MSKNNLARLDDLSPEDQPAVAKPPHLRVIQGGVSDASHDTESTPVELTETKEVSPRQANRAELLQARAASYEAMRQSLALTPDGRWRYDLFPKHQDWISFVENWTSGTLTSPQQKILERLEEEKVRRATVYREDRLALRPQVIEGLQSAATESVHHLTEMTQHIPEAAALLPRLKKGLEDMLQSMKDISLTGGTLSPQQRTALLLLSTISTAGCDAVSAGSSLLAIAGPVVLEGIAGNLKRKEAEGVLSFFEDLTTSKWVLTPYMLVTLALTLFADSGVLNKGTYAALAYVVAQILIVIRRNAGFQPLKDWGKDKLDNGVARLSDSTSSKIKAVLQNRKLRDYKQLATSIVKIPAFLPDSRDTEIMDPPILHGVVNIGTGEILRGPYHDILGQINFHDEKNDFTEAVIHILRYWNGGIAPTREDIGQDVNTPWGTIPWEDAVARAKLYAGTLLPRNPHQPSRELVKKETKMEKTQRQAREATEARRVRKLRDDIADIPMSDRVDLARKEIYFSLSATSPLKKQWLAFRDQNMGVDYLDLTLQILEGWEDNGKICPRPTEWKDDVVYDSVEQEERVGLAKLYAVTILSEPTEEGHGH